MQAVILAKNFGKSLEPMTDTRQKCMVPILGKPLLVYLLDLLYSAHILDVKILTSALSGEMENVVKAYQSTKLHVELLVQPTNPDTVGSVKAALQNQEEPVLLLRADAFYDVPLDALIAFHEQKQAAVTVVAKRMQNPCEHCVLRCTEDYAIENFIDRPAWCSAASGLVNTGMYLLSPQVLSMLPDTLSFVHTPSFLERMLQEKQPLYAFVSDAYWNPIGDFSAYRALQARVLEGKTSVALPKLAAGIFAREDLPKGEYTLLPPVYIGRHVQIGKGAVLGPYTVIEDGVSIEEGAHLRQSVVHSHAQVAAHAKVYGAILCAYSFVDVGARLCEHTVLGAHSVVGAYAKLESGVKVWPHKRVERLQTVRHTVKQGNAQRLLFDENGLLGTYGSYLEPAELANLGRVLSTVYATQKIGIAYAKTPLCHAAYHILDGAMTAAGSELWNFGEAFLSELYFFTAFCAFPLGIFLSESHGKLKISLFSAGGLPLEGAKEQEIETCYAQEAYPKLFANRAKSSTKMKTLEAMYTKLLLREADGDLSHQCVCVQSEEPKIRMLLEDVFYRAGAKSGNELTLKINKEGTKLSLFHRATGWVPHETLLALLCQNDLEHGKHVAVAWDAPYLLDELAETKHAKLSRYLDSPRTADERAIQEVARAQLHLRDALLLAVRLLGILEKQHMDFPTLLAQVPAFYEKEAYVPLTFSPLDLPAHLSAYAIQILPEGILVSASHGHALLKPSTSGKRLRILTESDSYAFSKELLLNLKETLTKD